MKYNQKSQLYIKHYIKKLVLFFFPLTLLGRFFFPQECRTCMPLKNHQKPDFNTLVAQCPAW